MITEPGPVKILAEDQDSSTVESILKRVDISVNKHKSDGIAIIAHYDCAGNPADEKTQKKQLNSAVNFLSQKYPTKKIISLWIGSDWKVNKYIVRKY